MQKQLQGVNNYSPNNNNSNQVSQQRRLLMGSKFEADINEEELNASSRSGDNKSSGKSTPKFGEKSDKFGSFRKQHAASPRAASMSPRSHSSLENDKTDNRDHNYANEPHSPSKLVYLNDFYFIN